MFHHVKELQFNARVSKPDPRFAALLLEQFGGGNGELKAAMQYFVQAFAARRPHPDKYDLLMDIAVEEFSHLEIVGATITMLTDGITGELKNAVETNPVAQLFEGKRSYREDLIHAALMNPQFLVQTGGGPAVTNASGVPWSGSFVNANGDLTVDLRSDIAAETRAKITYECLLQLTDDPLVRDSLRFLMTREITHYQQFTAALQSIEPNFPPAQLQGDPRYTHIAFNMSDGEDARGPWNEGRGPWGGGEEWEYVSDPIDQVRQTKGQTEKKPQGTSRTPKEAQEISEQLSRERSEQVKKAAAKSPQEWTPYK
jgi:Mn-containing catalase